MNEQPISKEERDVVEAARTWNAHVAFDPKWNVDAQALRDAIKALDRARTPPKPMTLVGRLQQRAWIPHTYDGRVVNVADAEHVAREFALEEMERCLAVCVEREKGLLGEERKAAAWSCGVLIKELISEARGR